MEWLYITPAIIVCLALFMLMYTNVITWEDLITAMVASVFLGCVWPAALGYIGMIQFGGNDVLNRRLPWK